MSWRGYYVERADPDVEGYEEGSISGDNLIKRYKWANSFVCGLTLDIPMGMGWGASLLTNAREVIGIDNNKEAVGRASSLYSNIILVNGDMTHVPIKDNTFDTVVCCEGYEHVNKEDQFKLISELHRVIKGNGVLLMTIPTKGHSKNNQFHLYEPTFEEVKENLMGKFMIIKIQRFNVVRIILRPII